MEKKYLHLLLYGPIFVVTLSGLFLGICSDLNEDGLSDQKEEKRWTAYLLFSCSLETVSVVLPNKNSHLALAIF